jgi:hypothetical protein
MNSGTKSGGSISASKLIGMMEATPELIKTSDDKSN